MSRRIRANGAFYAYVSAGLGRYTVPAPPGWRSLRTARSKPACTAFTGASLSALIATYTGVSIPWWLLVLVTMAGVQLLGSRNVELGAKFLAVLVGAEVAILLAFGISVLASGGGPEGISLSASFSPARSQLGHPAWPSCSLSPQCSASNPLRSTPTKPRTPPHRAPGPPIFRSASSRSSSPSSPGCSSLTTAPAAVRGAAGGGRRIR